MPPQPPTLDELAAAVSRTRFRCEVAAAAVFLAAPLTCVPGLDAGAGGGKVWVRGSYADCAGGLVSAVRAAADVARDAHVPGDQYLNLHADPATWFKVIASGTRRLVAGPPLLWGTPRVWADDEIRGSQIAAYVHHARTGSLGDPPALIVSGTPFLVDSRGRDVVLRTAPDTVREPGTEGPVAGSSTPVPQQVADRLGCAVVAVAPTTADAATVRAGGRMVAVTLRAWLPGAPGPRLVRVRVRLREDGWEFADLDAAPGPGRGLSVAYDPAAVGSLRGESVEGEPAWVASAGRAWVHRATGAKVTEVR